MCLSFAAANIAKVKQWVNKTSGDDAPRRSQEAAPPIPTGPRPRELTPMASPLSPAISEPAPIPPARKKNVPKPASAKPPGHNGIPEDGDQPPPLPPPRPGVNPLSTPPPPNPMDGGEYMGLCMDAPPPTTSRTLSAEQSTMGMNMSAGWGGAPIEKPRLRPTRSVPPESMQNEVPPPLPSRQPPQRAISREGAPPPLPARPAHGLPNMHNLPERSDSEASEDAAWTGSNSPPRRTPPPLPPGQGNPSNVLRLRDHWESRSRDSSPEGVRSSMDRDGKPNLPMRLAERTAPEGRASSSSDDVQLLDGLPPPLPAKSKPGSTTPEPEV